MPMKLELLAEDRNATRSNAILFVHGAWHGAWCWEKFLPYFAQHGYAAYALSLRGHGASDGRDRIRFHSAAKGYVADVAAVVQAIGRPTILVGHSMGGYVVQKYLEKNSAPAAILLASIPVSGILGFGLRYAKRHPWDFLKAHLTLDLGKFLGTPELAHDSLFSAIPDEELMRHFHRLQPESFVTELETLGLNLPKPRKVRAKKTPMLVLAAEKDTVFSVKEERRTARAYAVEDTMKIFPAMAHDMMLEPDWQQVADAMLEWMHGHNL